MSGRRKTYSGKFNPRNPSKYRGDILAITFRSLWERSFMAFLDEHSSIISWGSENVVIPYMYSVDQTTHRYFVDFSIEVLENNGKKQKYLIEIKPYCQTIPPVVKKVQSKRYIEDVCTFVKNQDKWKAARAYCDKNGLKFQVITEKELFTKMQIPRL